MQRVRELIHKSEQLYGLDCDTILSHRRTRTIAEARAVAMCASRIATNLSYPEIAEVFNRDPSTVVTRVDKVYKDNQLYIKAMLLLSK